MNRRGRGEANSAVIQTGSVASGLIARSGQGLFLVRWDADAINFFRGHQIQVTK